VIEALDNEGFWTFLWTTDWMMDYLYRRNEEMLANPEFFNFVIEACWTTENASLSMTKGGITARNWPFHRTSV
jgi:hypothetical protein